MPTSSFNSRIMCHSRGRFTGSAKDQVPMSLSSLVVLPMGLACHHALVLVADHANLRAPLEASSSNGIGHEPIHKLDLTKIWRV
jgi:hypothetical protein